MKETVKKKVLITEDDPGMQDVFRLIFERAGYAVDMHSSGNALLENDYQVPDIFVIDKQLSGVDGLDICRFLKRDEKTSHIPVIIVSATPHVHKMASDCNANDFLEKPFKSRDLLNVVAKHLQEAEPVA